MIVFTFQNISTIPTSSPCVRNQDQQLTYNEESENWPHAYNTFKGPSPISLSGSLITLSLAVFHGPLVIYIMYLKILLTAPVFNLFVYYCKIVLALQKVLYKNTVSMYQFQSEPSTLCIKKFVRIKVLDKPARILKKDQSC